MSQLRYRRAAWDGEVHVGLARLVSPNPCEYVRTSWTVSQDIPFAPINGLAEAGFCQFIPEGTSGSFRPSGAMTLGSLERCSAARWADREACRTSYRQLSQELRLGVGLALLRRLRLSHQRLSSGRV